MVLHRFCLLTKSETARRFPDAISPAYERCVQLATWPPEGGTEFAVQSASRETLHCKRRDSLGSQRCELVDAVPALVQSHQVAAAILQWSKAAEDAAVTSRERLLLVLAGFSNDDMPLDLSCFGLRSESPCQGLSGFTFVSRGCMLTQ